MAWPETPLTSYVANSTPAIKATDLNSIQSEINALYGYTAGKAQFLLYDDFAYGGQGGLKVDGAKAISDASMIGPWAVYGDAGDARTIIDNFSTPPSGTAGLVSFVNISGGVDNMSGLVASRLNIGTGDFALRFVLRIVNKAKIAQIASSNLTFGNASSVGLFVGMLDAGTSDIGIEAGNDEANFQILENGVRTAGGTGSAITNNTFYKVEMVRSSGTLTVYVNDTSVYSNANTVSYAKATPVIYVHGLTTLGAGGEAVSVDQFRLSFPR